MKSPVFISSANMITPLGFSVNENCSKLLQGVSAIVKYDDPYIAEDPFYAAIISSEKIDEAFKILGNPSDFTKLEKMMILSLSETLKNSEAIISDKTALIIATTKGNIDVLETRSKFDSERAYLPELGKRLQHFFKFKKEPIIVSNACVSGILAVAVAKRMIENNFYENAVVVAGDLVTKFTVSGFKSFQAMSDVPCKPYDKKRNGISIGEAAASVFISKKDSNQSRIQIIGDGSCNDANHISGPSRTGEGLYKSVQSALEEASVNAQDIDFISAHGTATLYNDEMEAIAFNRSQLSLTPLHSLKGYFGHTFGTSGLLETVVLLDMMKNNTVYPSLGLEELGVSKPLNIVKKVAQQSLNIGLKTASGFGGCNTAVLFKKER